MLGYVTAEKGELKIKEYELYSGYYCGLCKATGRKYGQLARFSLNYDSVFLALLLASISDEPDSIVQEHCIVHPIKKKTIVQNNHAVNYAADIMVLLAYYKLKDNAHDNHNFLWDGLAAVTKPMLNDLFQSNAPLCQFVQHSLDELRELENQHCASLDEACEPFASLMQRVFTDPLLLSQNAMATTSDSKLLILGQMGYHLGKWIYLMDAFDDIEENIKDGNYNPLLYRFAYKPTESSLDFRSRINGQMEYNLLFCLSELTKAWELLDSKKHQGLITNILYMGLLRRAEQLLQKGTTTDEKSL